MMPELRNVTLDFTVSAPLSRTDAADTVDFFSEDTMAHAMYVAHRSFESPANTVTHHLHGSTGKIAGLISYRVAEEADDGHHRLFVCVEYAFIRRRFRGLGLSHLLLRPIVQQVDLHVAGIVSSQGKCRIQSASIPESKRGARMLRALEAQFARIAASNPGLGFVGRYFEHPRGLSMVLRHRPTMARSLPEPVATERAWGATAEPPRSRPAA